MPFSKLIPSLDVKDVDESIDFYTDALGFAVSDKLTWDGETGWALLQAGDVSIMLNIKEKSRRRSSRAAAKSKSSKSKGTNRMGIFFFCAENLDELHQELSTKGYSVSGIVSTQPGSKEFYVSDPDGYICWFTHKYNGNGNGILH